MDYGLLAKAYGGAGYSVSTVETLHEAFLEAGKESVTCLFDIKTIPGTMTGNYDAWWRVGTAQVSTHREVEAAAVKIKEELKKAKQY